jgi:thiol-disulfide isomerase/thioredoxin
MARLLSLVIAGGGLMLLGAVALAYLFWSQAGASNLPGGFESAIPLAVDYPAPRLELKELDGNPASLADFAGQVVLVNNWAFWCPPCRAELPILERYYQDHRAQGFTVIGIESGGSAQTVSQYVEGYKLTYPIWLDPRIKAVAAFRNRSLPNSYVIDGDGQVRLAWTGPVSREMLENYVSPLLEK